MTVRRAALLGLATGCAAPLAVAVAAFTYGAAKHTWGK